MEAEDEEEKVEAEDKKPYDVGVEQKEKRQYEKDAERLFKNNSKTE